MNNVFFKLLDKCVVIYLDDILIFSNSIEEHKVHLEEVFRLLQQNQLYVKDSKCNFFMQKIEFLGHVVTPDGIEMDSGKVKAVIDWPAPTNLTEVQQFLGLSNYCRRFVDKFSELSAPLVELTRKNIPFTWGVEQV